MHYYNRLFTLAARRYVLVRAGKELFIPEGSNETGFFNGLLTGERRCGVNEGGTGESGSDPYLDVPPDVFIGRLESYERVLLDLKDQLYEGSWERILDDLRARLDNKPYVYKLSQTIARDLAAIERMKAYEIRQKVSLSKLLHKAG